MRMNHQLHRLLEKLNIELGSMRLSLFVSLLLVIFYNVSFFSETVNAVIDPIGVRSVIFLISIAVLLLLLTFIVISLCSFPYIFKPFLVVILIGAASTNYFMNEYGIVIHRLMIQNLFETDVSEIAGLVNTYMFIHILLMGIVPSLMLLKIKITYASPTKEIWIKIKCISIAFILSIGLILSMSMDYASFFRKHKDIRQMANPLNFIYAGISYLLDTNQVTEVKPIENDAVKNAIGKNQKKPALFILVVGETARADHFGLNGYQRDTTPLLSNQDIINFSDVSSCGTETAVSVPCMFSSLGQKHYSSRKAKSQEGLLDVISHAGFNVVWRDNNSSCKGACDRVKYENVQRLTVPEFCNNRECFDEILLHNLDDNLSTSDMLIVLHQKGSHGPDYFNRYPEHMNHYLPACKTNLLQNCSTQEVINAYDNTIRYTDYFLNKTIEWLKTKSNTYYTAMIYLSDHGESLGEHNIYLHGMPYSIAPKEQKSVPFFMWLSPEYELTNDINRQCLMRINDQHYSHDNLFHTVLGLLNIQTKVYNSKLDITHQCRNI